MSERKPFFEHPDTSQERALQNTRNAKTLEEFEKHLNAISLSQISDEELIELIRKLRTFPDIQRFEEQAPTGITIGFPKVWVNLFLEKSKRPNLEDQENFPSIPTLPSTPTTPDNPWAPPSSSETPNTTFGEQLLAFLKSLGKK